MKQHLVITTISHPNTALEAYAAGCKKHGYEFVLIGDTKSPEDFRLPAARFYSLSDQRKLTLKYPKLCPERHYSRKNIGYLLAISEGAEVIVETDDDNIPTPEFWGERTISPACGVISGSNYVNIFHYFSDKRIWPRGFPLEKLWGTKPMPSSTLKSALCPIQQGLADNNPDVDAIYRLTMPLPVNFDRRDSLALSDGAWCPFNSQNTTWFPDAYMLLYLPSFCSFRMTDIWRSFVAQRIAWTNGWSVLFHNATVFQERNEHNLMNDFADEIDGYCNNLRIMTSLQTLKLESGSEHLPENLLKCYSALVEIGVIKIREIDLLKVWISDIQNILKYSAKT